jgi:hypothetical protein
MTDNEVFHADQDEKPTEQELETKAEETTILPRDPDQVKDAEPAPEPEPEPTPKEILAQQNPDFMFRHSKRTAS